MSEIALVAVTDEERLYPDLAAAVTLELLDELAARLAKTLRVSCHVEEKPFPAGFAFDDRRTQYHSTAILKRLAESNDKPGRVLGVTSGDLYVPVLTFVFGEAQLDGNSAVVSVHRLHEEFYGLPPNPGLLGERLAKLALHELGHTFGLRHCENWECVMASTHSVERLDIKSAEYCASCGHILNRTKKAQPPAAMAGFSTAVIARHLVHCPDRK